MTSAFITVLRFCCINSSDALRFERYSQLHIGELVLTGSEFAQIPWAIWRIAMIRHHLPCLHTINPDFAPTVAEMYESLGETSEWLTDEGDRRVPH